MMTAEQEIKMFGCTKAELTHQIQEEFFSGGSMRDVVMITMGIMSDCQEMLNRNLSGNYNCTEEVRQALNRAKFILATYVR
jgi:hypothetical protein